MRRRPAASLAAAALAAGCTRYDSSLFGAAGPVAADERWHFVLIVALAALVVVPAVILAPLAARRYGYRRAGAAYAPDWEFSWKVEVPLWGIPVLLVAALSALLWRSTLDLDPYAPVGAGPPFEVEAIGYDWKWLFIYPEQGVASVGVLAIPEGRPVRVRLTSGANLLSFHVPALAGQIYAMPGMVTEQNLRADRTGRFLGQNTQYNGRGFHEQKFVAEAMDPAALDAFLARARAEPPLGGAALGAVEARSTGREMVRALGRGDASAEAGPNPEVLFGAVPSDLFARTVVRFGEGRQMHGGAGG